MCVCVILSVLTFQEIADVCVRGLVDGGVGPQHTLWTRGGPANSGKSVILTSNGVMSACAGFVFPAEVGADRAPREPVIRLQAKVYLRWLKVRKIRFTQKNYVQEKHLLRWQGSFRTELTIPGVIYLFSGNSVKNSVSSCPWFCFVQESHCCFSMPAEKSLKLISCREFISSSISVSKDETNLCLWIPCGPLSLHKVLIGLSNTTAAAVAVTPRHISFCSWHSICVWWILIWAHTWPGPYQSSEIYTDEGKQNTTTFQNTKQHFTKHSDNLENAAKFHQTLRHFRFVAFCEKSCLVKGCRARGNVVSVKKLRFLRKVAVFCAKFQKTQKHFKRHNILLKCGQNEMLSCMLLFCEILLWFSPQMTVVSQAIGHVNDYLDWYQSQTMIFLLPSQTLIGPVRIW